MKIENGDLVVPGDFLGIIEQYLPGNGTYDDEGDIKSSIAGNVTIDNRTISIIPKSGEPSVLKIGDRIYGQITDVRGQRAMINLDRLKHTDRQLALPYMGAIHISQVKNGYLDKLTDAFRIGDIIEGEVSKISSDNVDLSTIHDECGVVKAMCTRCRAYMKTTSKPDELYCEVCNKKEKRKVSSNYVNE
ncbi:exosome complex RNA-binding protein Csl4 [Methanobrevibacter sp. OttesenSCG-928-K11]|nr:exosome complex RNA-binding protein Csl4 [Methanobrevibacter sp. OttesenSCG-928-K11]MDL2270421.1 exosome complex RNA-binding protein Csl4 [Methanobrevibacter sp. OttesenSCG-928-I08]